MHVSYKKLFKLLIDKEIKKVEFSHLCDISGSTLAKLSSDKYVSLEVLCKACLVLNCTLDDIVEVIKDEEDSKYKIIKQ